MPAHVFVLDDKNYNVCIHRGIVGLPEAAPGSKNEPATNDALLSRMAIVKESDYILFYVTGVKELRGIWEAVGQSFYDETPVWEDKTYPFRFRLESTQYSFQKPLRLNDIFDLRNAGKIWTFALNRASGTNAMFSISDAEFDILLQEYLKINPFTMIRNIIMEPYPVKPANLFEKIHRVENSQSPRYEASLMALLLGDFAKNAHQDVFGNYSDYLSYVPTNLGTEIDILLFFNNPQDENQTMSYDIIEVKLDRFDGKALHQLIGYETWFIHKKVQGDMNMVRVSAIAKRFDADVVAYVQNRKRFENKEIKLFQYEVTPSGRMALNLL
jgi:hypothetical protein